MSQALVNFERADGAIKASHVDASEGVSVNLAVTPLGQSSPATTWLPIRRAMEAGRPGTAKASGRNFGLRRARIDTCVDVAFGSLVLIGPMCRRRASNAEHKNLSQRNNGANSALARFAS